MRKYLQWLALLVLGQQCLAEVCAPLGEPKADSPYSYIRTELKVLKWMRLAANDSQKVLPFVDVSEADPNRLHKLIARHEAINAVSDDYNCATELLKPYRESSNENIRASVTALLQAINVTNTADAKLVEMMESLDGATSPGDIDQGTIAKRIADINGIKKDVRTLTVMAVKMSTFSIVKVEGGEDESKPVAFTITDAERGKLLAEAKELAKRQGKDTYLDFCADFLVRTLTQPLPSLAK